MVGFHLTYNIIRSVSLARTGRPQGDSSVLEHPHERITEVCGPESALACPYERAVSDRLEVRVADVGADFVDSS